MVTEDVKNAVRQQYEEIKNGNLRPAIRWVLFDGQESDEDDEKRVDEYISMFDACVDKLAGEISRHTTIPDEVQIQTKNEKVRIAFLAEDFQIQIMFFMESPFSGSEWVLNYVEV